MGILFKTTKFILDVLPKKHKARLLGVSFLLLTNTLLELLGLGALIPVFSVLLEDNVVEKYSWANWLFNKFGLTDERQLILVLALALFVIIIIKNVLSLWIANFNSTFALGLYKDFTLHLHKIYYKNGFSFFKENNSTLVVRNLNAATNRFANIQVLGSLTLFNELMVLFLILCFMLIYSPIILGLLGLTVLPSFYFFYRWVREKSLVLGQRRNAIEPDLNKNLYQSIFGYVDVIITGAERSFRDRINANVKELTDIDIKTSVYNLAPTRVIESALMFAIALIVSFGIFLLDSKIELLKLLGLFAIAGYRIMPSINKIMIAFNGLNQSEWILDVLLPLNQSSNKSSIKSGEISFNERLSLQNVSFTYSGSEYPILKNLNLTIRKGEVIGLIGPSGAGKTTLMNMLLGFLKPSEGAYKIDEVELREEHLQSFYQKVGYVQQQVYLIDGSIAENVAFGIERSDIDNAKLKRVLERASIWETVRRLPNGVNELIGENGTRLSGGQRQRIGIARALYFDAEILFFDEATSSLDSETEEEITDAIQKLADGRITLIIIAHRMTTLRNCTKIIEVNPKEVLI